MIEIFVGLRFGLWKVLERGGPQGDNRGARWICQCDCGTIRLVKATYLRNSKSTSCGCAGKYSLSKSKDRFFKRIGVPDAVTGCWPWLGPFTRGNYGCVFFMGKTYRANRVSYLLHKGDIRDGFIVCHKCDNPSCVNPDHLFLGTYKDNNLDMHAKGRAPKSNRKIAGESNVWAKLTDSCVKEIRRLVAEGITKAEVGRKFGIRDSHVCKIVQRKLWAHVP